VHGGLEATWSQLPDSNVGKIKAKWKISYETKEGVSKRGGWVELSPAWAEKDIKLPLKKVREAIKAEIVEGKKKRKIAEKTSKLTSDGPDICPLAPFRRQS